MLFVVYEDNNSLRVLSLPTLHFLFFILLVYFLFTYIYIYIYIRMYVFMSTLHLQQLPRKLV